MSTCFSPPIKKSRRETTVTYHNRKVKSYVWHYFDRMGGIAKCRICRYEIESKHNSLSTTGLIWHLEHVHALEERGIFVKDFSSIPTLSRWSRNMGSCMRKKVLGSFQASSTGSWRCKKCGYTVRVKKLHVMFHHLRKVHWKANGPASDEFNEDREAQRTDATTSEQQIGDGCNVINFGFADIANHFVQPTSDNRSNKLREDGESSLGDVDDVFGPRRLFDSSSRSSCDFVRQSTIGTVDARKPSEVKMNLANGDQVTGFVIGADDEDKVVENRANDMHESRKIVTDNRRHFDHWYSKVVSSKQTKISCSELTTTSTRRNNNGNDGGGLSDSDEPEIIELDVQVPLQKISNLIPNVKYCGNGEPPISYEYIKTKKTGQKQNVAVVTLNRPKALNALCKKLVDELNDAVSKYDKENTVDAIVITGNKSSFAAGTDVKEMQNYTYAQMVTEDLSINWDGISKARKPVIAAVNGYALGGGFELALACDIIYAGENACFGLPEVVIGTIPGAGGTQRLTKVMGKSKAMEMILTGIQISAAEAEKSGLVSKIFPSDQLLIETIKLGERISAHSQLIVSMAKKSINAAYETTLQGGLDVERNLFSGTFATADRKEGMTAFIDKRVPEFRNA